MPPSDINDDLASAGAIVSIEVFEQMADVLNAGLDSVGVGEIAPIVVVSGRNSEPDSSIWVECSGGTVTDQLSPLRNQSIPDMRDKYLCGADSPSTVGLFGGANTVNLSHDHGGLTPTTGTHNDALDASGGGLFVILETAAPHNHAVTSDLSSSQNIEPTHYTVKFYLKIR